MDATRTLYLVPGSKSDALMPVFTHHFSHCLKWLYFEDSDVWSDIGAFYFIMDTNQGEGVNILSVSCMTKKSKLIHLHKLNSNQERSWGKIPELTLLFWIMKITATTLGETGGDLLAQTLNVGYASSTLIFFAFFLVMVTCQLIAKKYIPVIFWAVIVATSTAGTTMSDYMDRTLGLGYAVGSMILVSVLIITLITWRLTEKTLSVTNIRSFRGETFYWIAILFSNTLGTALGDFLADDSGLGFGGSALLITAVLLIVVFAYYYTKISRVVLFWIAFVLTRPFGATFGDLLTKPHEKGGLNYGTLGASLILFGLLIGLIIYETIKLKRQQLTK